MQKISNQIEISNSDEQLGPKFIMTFIISVKKILLQLIGMAGSRGHYKFHESVVGTPFDHKQFMRDMS
jgi:hypothetical protein